MNEWTIRHDFIENNYDLESVLFDGVVSLYRKNRSNSKQGYYANELEVISYYSSKYSLDSGQVLKRIYGQDIELSDYISKINVKKRNRHKLVYLAWKVISSSSPSEEKLKDSENDNPYKIDIPTDWSKVSIYEIPATAYKGLIQLKFTDLVFIYLTYKSEVMERKNNQGEVIVGGGIDKMFTRGQLQNDFGLTEKEAKKIINSQNQDSTFSILHHI